METGNSFRGWWQVIGETVSELDNFAAPYGREIKLENIAYENGMRVLRIRIREGNRFTTMDIDENTASRWSAVMNAWVEQAPGHEAGH
jgi:hypothetical protein